MAWDKSNGMYYRSHRVGKRVLRVYYGKGDVARLAAALDDYRRRQTKRIREAAQSLRRQWDAACAPLVQLREAMDQLMQAVRVAVRHRRFQLGAITMNSNDMDIIAELRRLVAAADPNVA